MLCQRLCLAPNVGVAIKQAMRYLHVCMPHKAPKAADSERGSRCGGGASQGRGRGENGKRKTHLFATGQKLIKQIVQPARAPCLYTHPHPHTHSAVHPFPCYSHSTSPAIKTTIVKSKHGAWSPSALALSESGLIPSCCSTSK